MSTSSGIWQRAYRDTERCLGYLWYYPMLVVVPAITGFYAAFGLPVNPSQLEQAVYGAVGTVIGALALVGFTFVVCLLLAPSRLKAAVQESARRQALSSDEKITEVKSILLRRHERRMLIAADILAAKGGKWVYAAVLELTGNVWARR